MTYVETALVDDQGSQIASDAQNTQSMPTSGGSSEGGTNNSNPGHVTVLPPVYVHANNQNDLMNAIYGSGINQLQSATSGIPGAPSILTSGRQQIAVIINGSTFNPLAPNGSGLTSSGNPFGHAAVAVSGYGVFSYGNNTPSGSSTTDYLASQANNRNSTVIVIDVSSEQANQVANYFLDNANEGVTIYGNNCVVISSQGLNAGGINLTENVPGPGPNGVVQVPIGNFPGDMQDGAMNYINNNGGDGPNSGYYVNIPKGSSPPGYLKAFDPSG